MGRLVLSISLFFLAIWSQAQEVTVAIALAEERIYYGESVQLQVKLSGADGTAQITTASLEADFTVQAAGDQSLSSSVIRIINGRRTVEEFSGHLFAYLLSPKASGSFTVGPLAVTYRGQTFASNRLTLQVIGTQEREEALVVIVPSQRECILSETFSVALEIYLKRLPGEFGDADPIAPQYPLILKIPWLDEMPGLGQTPLQDLLKPYVRERGTPGFGINDIKVRSDNLFSMFDEPVRAVFALPRKPVTRTSPQGQVQEYFCYTLNCSLVAKKLGEYTFGPVLMKGSLVVPSAANARSLVRQESVIMGSPVTVRVTEPPVTGRPVEFTGAIGTFQVQAQAIPQALYVGDPLTLVLTIQGNGQLENILPPKLSSHTNLAQYFTIYEDKIVTEQTATTKIFRYPLRVKSADLDQIPAIAFAYFDTATRQYQTVHTTPIPLTIKVPESVKPDEIVQAPSTVQPITASMHKQSRGIFANYTKPDGLIPQTAGWQAWHTATVLFWPLAYLLLWSLTTYHRTKGRDPVYQRRKKALANALNSLEQLDHHDMKICYRQIYEAVAGAVADWCNLPQGSQVPLEIADHLQKRNAPAALVRTCVEFLDHCIAVQYGANLAAWEADKAKASALCRQLAAEILRK